MEQEADEIRRLKTCLSDLVGVLGLRAIWSGGEPSRIVSTLLDVLVWTLRLDFAYARFQDPMGGAPVESVRVGQERNFALRAPELGRLLDVWLQDLPHAALLQVPDPMGEGDVSIVAVRLGLQDAMGMLVAGSSRADFPLQTERLLLNVAANQAAIGLHEGRRLTQRAMELVAANEELNREIAERRRAEAERVKLEERLRQAEKMQAIGTLAGGIAHDFNNILGAILGHGELAQRKAGESGPLREHLDQVMQAGNRGKRLVEQILAFSRSGVGARIPVHVQSVVEETLDLLAASLPPTIRLEKMLNGADAAVLGDATQLHQVTMNLCTNALQAMPNGGVVSVTLERTDIAEPRELAHGTLTPRQYVGLQVRDTGTGIAPAVLERIFDPFFTTKRVGEGTGLGLSLVYGIVADHGGAVDVATREGAGTAFTVWLPTCGEAPARDVDAAGVLPHGNGEAVLIVDDERPLVSFAEEMLAGLGYEAVGFSSSADALAALRTHPDRYDVVLTDETMPDMTGTDLAREIRRLRADIPIVLMSGHSGPQFTERARAAGVSDILRKPLVSRDIAEALARVMPVRA